jgi:hypothetical protein
MAEKTGNPGATQEGALIENKDEPTPEQQEQAFATGFDKGISEYDIGSPVRANGAGDDQGAGAEGFAASGQAPPAGEGKAAQSTGKQTAASPDVKELKKRVRHVEGSLGGILDRLDTISNQIAAARPAATDNQDAGAKGSAAASLKHVDELERIIGAEGEFRELEPIKRELEDMRAMLARLEESGGGRQEVQQAQLDIGRIVEETTLNVKFPEWRQITAKPEFLKFALAEGPATTEYDEYRKLLNDPKTESQADQMAAGWREDHPDWWKERGSLFFSESASDSVALLDQFDRLQRRKQEYSGHQERQQNRLRRAAVLDGISESPATGKTEEEAFLSGFKRGSSAYGGFRRN